MMESFVGKLRRSWDSDRSIIQQTDEWMKQRRDAADEIERLEARVDDLEDALHKIRNWCQAYPVDVFTPPTQEQIKASVLAMNSPGCASSAAMHGAWARHILSEIEAYTDILQGEK